MLWVTDWWDGPVEGMAFYAGPGMLVPRGLRRGSRRMDLTAAMPGLYELDHAERKRLWASHRRWEQSRR